MSRGGTATGRIAQACTVMEHSTTGCTAPHLYCHDYFLLLCTASHHLHSQDSTLEQCVCVRGVVRGSLRTGQLPCAPRTACDTNCLNSSPQRPSPHCNAQHGTEGIDDLPQHVLEPPRPATSSSATDQHRNSALISKEWVWIITLVNAGVRL